MIRFSGSSMAFFRGRMLMWRWGRGVPMSARASAVMADDGGQLARGDPGAGAPGDGPLDGRLELADVARPVVPPQDFQRVAGEPRDGLAEFVGMAGAERLGQQLDVHAAMPQRGEHQADDVDAMVEHLVEPALLDQGRRLSLVDITNRMSPGPRPGAAVDAKSRACSSRNR